jgi:hypothetical protein
VQNLGQSQCIALTAQTLLIAAPEGRSWLAHTDRPALIPLPASAVATERASLAASALEGAIYAGLTETDDACVTPRDSAEPYSLPRYLRWLAGNYVFAGQTPVLFRRGAQRLEAKGRADLAAVARRKATEESGHAQLAYRDLEALGLPAARVIALVQPPSATVFAERFSGCVEADAPIALFGFSYCLERMALERDPDFAQKVKETCPPGVRAFRFLTVHSSVGSDSSHVYEQLALFESFGPDELASVTRTVYETARLLATQPAIDAALTDPEILRRLHGAGIALPQRPHPTTPEGVS